MDLETRLQESEIKLAFLERELADHREAVDALHAELSRLAKRVKTLESRNGADDMDGAQAPGFASDPSGDDPGAGFPDSVSPSSAS